MKKNLYQTILNLNKFNTEFSKDKFRLISYNNVFKDKSLFLYHFTTHKYFLDDPYRNILINYLKKAESLYPGGSFTLSKKIVNKILKIEDLKFKVENKSYKNLEKYFNQNYEKENVINFLNILHFSGPDAVINCNITKNKDFKVIKNKNPYFEISLHESFLSTYFKNQETLTKNYLTCIYDGYVERESELYSLIEKSKNNNNAPVLLVCRGISDYAVNHLKQVLLKNSVILMPYVCKFSNDDPFIFEDLCKALKIKPFNIESGDNIYKKLSENSDFKKIKLFTNKIEILEDLNLKFLQEINVQIKTASNESDLKKYLFKRKNRCYPNIVSILIPDTDVQLLSVYKSMIKSYNCIAKEGFLSNKDKLFSYYEYNKVTKLCRSLENSIKKIGCVVKVKE